MPTLESATIPLMEFTRTVYGSNASIPHTELKYSDHPLNGKPVPDDCRRFHQKLVELGTTPTSLQQRYGVDPYKTYCNPQTHPAEYIRETDVENLREAMERAIDALLWDIHTPVVDREVFAA
jgi:hypothetical protein